MTDRDEEASGNPRVGYGEADPTLHELRAPARSLVEALGPTVDMARQIAVDLGVRPYTVTSITVRWSGGAVGRGEARLVSEVEWLPTPELRSMDGVRGAIVPVGRVERGDARLRRVSPRYTEAELFAMCGCALVDQALQVWIEVRVDERDGETRRRRFTVQGVPTRRPFEWEVTLAKADEDRTPGGLVRDVTPR